MPRPLLIRSTALPYHVRARSNNKEWFYLPIEQIWDIFLDRWEVTTEEYGIHLHAFVLMSNHFHAILSTPNENLDQAMHHLLREVSREINKQASRINHIFGGPYKWSLITTRRYYEHALRYVYQNPIKAEICKRVEEYPYSTIHFHHGIKDKRLDISESVFDRQSVLDLTLSQKLEWLNECYSKEENECIKRALHYSQFKFRKANISFNTRYSLNNEKNSFQQLLFT